MDETKQRPGSPGDRAQAAAEKLRALRERANDALDEHRQRLSQIECELSTRVRQLTDEFETSAAGGQPPAGRDGEMSALREQLEADRGKHDKFIEQLAAARRQLDAIQAQPCAACQDAAQQLADAQGEINRLREQLKAAEAQQEADAARHDKFSEQVAAARQAIADLQSRSHDQTASLQAELDAARAAKAAAAEQVASLARDLELQLAECNALQAKADKLEQERTASLDEQRQAADAEAKSLREKISKLESELAGSQAVRDDAQSRVKLLDAELAAARESQDDRASEIATVRKHHAELEARLAELTASHAAELKTQADHLASAQAKEADGEKQLADAAAKRGEVEKQLAAVEAQRAEAEKQLAEADAKRVEAEQQLAAVEADKTGLAESLAAGEAERRQLNAALAAAQEQVDSLTEASADAAAFKASLDKAQAEAAEHQRAGDNLKTSLDEAQAELAKVRAQSCPQSDLADLQQKFDLALADAQKLKRESAELRQQLASRPEMSEEESAELVALRTERDELTRRVKELEKTAAAAGEAAGSQEFDDLQRRFQMAVDDVRQLKQENAQLRDQAAKIKSSPAAGGLASPGANDWASQKARLLAMLESEESDGPIDAERRKQRATIEETIEQTDAAIADKERELAELRDAVDHAEGPSCNLDREHEQILAADELVAAERERLAKLQSEWEDKLRAAELEFSVERAKLAREQAAVKERQFDLQKLEAQGAGLAAEGGDHKPRRRWLAALGLGEEHEDEKKPTSK